MVSLLITLCACGHGKEEQTAKPAVAVEVAVAAPSELVEELAVTGTLTARNAAELKSELPGLYREVYVTEWVAVRKGQPLARIQADETATLVKRAEAGVLQVQVEAERAVREAERMRSLRSAGLATQQQLDDADSARAAAAARQRAAEEELAQLRVRLAKSVVRAPLDGVVAQRNVNVGDLAGADSGGKVIFRIVDNRRLDLTVTVPSNAIGRVALGQSIEFGCDGLPGQLFTGTVKRLNPSVNPIDRSLQVMAEIDNRDGRLRDGLFVKGRIVTGRRGNVLLVPRSALTSFDPGLGRGALFVVTGEQAQRREVQTGSASREQIEVVAGLQAGERYVTRGGFNLRDGDRVSIGQLPPPAGKGQGWNR
jgi:RND family efflux transporter MFP subunit